jgi:hypothetical protein
VHSSCCSPALRACISRERFEVCSDARRPRFVALHKLAHVAFAGAITGIVGITMAIVGGPEPLPAVEPGGWSQAPQVEPARAAVPRTG